MALTGDDITSLLQRWQTGEEQASGEVFTAIYDLLRRQAGIAWRLNPSPTVQATALVHEAWLRMQGQDGPWQDRGHFFAVASVVMRRILVDAARERNAEKRGGGVVHILIDDSLALMDAKNVDVLLLDEGLRQLEAIDPRQARIVELRFFGGLSNDEIAALLGTSAKTVQRGWGLARAWLRKYIHEDGPRE